jgi:hypothetical protein
MSHREMRQWLIYSQYCPIGPERFDYLFASLEWCIARCHCDPKKPPKFKDFLIKWFKKPIPPEIQLEIAKIQAQARANRYSYGQNKSNRSEKGTSQNISTSKEDKQDHAKSDHQSLPSDGKAS